MFRWNKEQSPLSQAKYRMDGVQAAVIVGSRSYV